MATSSVTYDYSPPTNSVFLNLKNNGDACKIRIVSEPIKFADSYQGKPTERFAWLVIDRADQVIKVFKCGPDIWKKVTAFVKDPDWGDPMTYDLTVTRVGTSPSNFYSVTPSPVGKGPLNEIEMAVVMASDIDLAKAVEMKRKTDE
jgi:hypothetical protein